MFIVRNITNYKTNKQSGFLDRADGSIKYSQGNTSGKFNIINNLVSFVHKTTFLTKKKKVIVSVYGPMEVKHKDELVDKTTFEVNIKPRSGIAGPNEKSLESLIKGSYESLILGSFHPRTLISVTIQIMNDGKSLHDL